ncbi:MAG: amidohydrolase [Actinomycetota bacterium]|nr:amidohydrolase [Actinomycetota bacterium]
MPAGDEGCPTGRTRLAAGAVVTGDAAGSIWRPGVVDIDGGRIVHVGPSSSAPEHHGRTVACPGLVMPGLVNTHGHSPMTLLRGVGEGLPLDRWLRHAIWPREAHLTPEDVFWGMTLGCGEMLRCGVTTSCETYFHDTAVVDAVVEAGMRCLVTPGILDIPGTGPGRGWRAMLDAAGELHAEADGRAGLVSVGLGPHAAYTLPVEALTAAGRLARELDTILTIHLAETASEDHQLQAEHSMTVPALLDEIGVLDARVLAAHAVWLTDADIALLAERRVAVAHCPQSNAKLGSGIARLVDLLQAGVTVGLGTDGPASNNDLDLWEELRLAPLLARARAADASVIDAVSAFGLATRGGAAALGIDAGVLAPGRLADVVHVRTDDPRFVPVLADADLMAHLVWSSASHLVADVWVGGRQVVAAGVCTSVDTVEAARQVQARAARLAAAVGR